MRLDLEFFENFTWAVPRALANAVGTCRFEQGDVLYSDPAAYSAWPEGQNGLQYQLQVMDPPKTSRALSAEQEGSRFSANWLSPIEFELTDRRSGSCSRRISTQGRVFACLWRGDPEILSDEFDAPAEPLGQRELHSRLQELEAFLGERLVRFQKGLHVYVAAVDESSDASRLKAQAVETALSESFADVVSDSVGPVEAGIDPLGEFHPALMLRALGVPTDDPQAIEGCLRKALYAGTGSRFSLSRHGHLFGPVKG